MGLRFRRRTESMEPIAPAHDPSALPADLAACLESATVVPRHFREEGPRAVVQIDSAGWIHNPEESRAQLLRRWPTLTDAQLNRALRHLTALVRRSGTPMPAKRRSWVWDY